MSDAEYTEMCVLYDRILADVPKWLGEGGDPNISRLEHHNPSVEHHILCYACNKLMFKEATMLVEAGSNPNGLGGTYWSPLHDTLMTGSVHATEEQIDTKFRFILLLLKKGADRHAVNSNGFTARYLISLYKLSEMKWLFDLYEIRICIASADGILTNALRRYLCEFL